MILDLPGLEAFEPLLRKLHTLAFTGGIEALASRGLTMKDIERDQAAHGRFICDRSKSRCPERMARPPSSGTSALVFASSRPRRRPGRPWPGGRPCGSVAFAQPRRGRG